MNSINAGAGDVQELPNVPPSPSLGQLKEALRVLDQTQYLFTGMKAKVMYACGEGHLLATDEGRPYLSKIIKSLDEEHRQIRANFPRLSAAMEVAREVNKLSALRAARSGAAAAGAGTGPGAGLAAAGRNAAAAVEAAAEAAPAAALQTHCRMVLEQLQAAVCEEVLAAGGAHLPRPSKRPRIVDAAQLPQPFGTTAMPSSATPSSPYAPPNTTPSTASASAPSSTGPGSTSTSPSTTAVNSLEDTSQLLCVLLRIRALDGSSACMAGAPAPALGGMRIHALDDGGNALSPPSSLTALLATAAAQGQATGSGVAATGAPGRLDGAMLAAGAARLSSATQVRMLLPGVFVANVLLEGPGNPAPLRVAVDCADRAFDLDPWATPTTQVFRRMSALATRVLTYYVKRAPLSAVPKVLAALPANYSLTPLTAAAAAPTATGATLGSVSTPAAPSGAAAGGGLAVGLSSLLPPEPNSPGAAALEDLLLWLLGCRDVFSKRCVATGRLMAWDPSVQYPVPPIFRIFKLPREELRLRALDMTRAAAYHMHVAPVEQLGWAEDVPAEAVDGIVTAMAVAASTMPVQLH